MKNNERNKLKLFLLENFFQNVDIERLCFRVTRNKSSSPVRLFLNDAYARAIALITRDQFILISRFLLVAIYYLIIFFCWQPKRLEEYFLIIHAPILGYVLLCFIGSRFFGFRTIHTVLTLFDIILISLSYYYLPFWSANGSIIIYLAGIIVNISYRGPIQGLITALVGSSLFIIIVAPIMAPKNLLNFSSQLINIYLVILLVCLLSNKAKQALIVSEIEKDESKKQYRQLQVLLRIAKEINGELELDKLLFLLIQKADELTKSEAGGIILLDDDQVYRIKATTKMPKTFWEQEISPGSGLPGKVLTEKKTVFDKKYLPEHPTDHHCDLDHYQFAIASPIWSKGTILGLIFLLRGHQGKSYTNDDKLILETLSEHAASAVMNAKLFKQTTTLSLHDYLTGIGNLRFFYQQLEHTFAVAVRYQHPFSLMIVDSDSLKLINDRYGNAQGFEHIKQLAELLKNSVRSSDIIARYDRDMFMVILPQTTLVETVNLAKRIQNRVYETPLIICNEVVTTTVSIGLSSFPEHADTPKSLINAVESALYKAKLLGKNQIVTAVTKPQIFEKKEHSDDL
jgi:diguanylate cyclase (GGDEF)-like protein